MACVTNSVHLIDRVIFLLDCWILMIWSIRRNQIDKKYFGQTTDDGNNMVVYRGTNWIAGCFAKSNFSSWLIVRIKPETWLF